MGVGQHFVFFHHHHQQQKYHHHYHDHDDQKTNVPKGCVAVVVGHEDEEQKRFIIPLMYMNHPLFMELLKEAEEGYGFKHDGPINIPCHVQAFYNVETMIDIDHDHHHHHICCFKD